MRILEFWNRDTAGFDIQQTYFYVDSEKKNATSAYTSSNVMHRTKKKKK
jgi:hypothetical protein